MKIDQFAYTIIHARKTTGVVLADNLFKSIIAEFEVAVFKLFNAVDSYEDRLFLTDDQLLDKLKTFVSSQPILVVNLELFIAPRINDEGFIEQFARKLVVAELNQPIILLFYSAKLYRTFATLYQLNPLTQRHTLDLTEDSIMPEE